MVVQRGRRRDTYPSVPSGVRRGFDESTTTLAAIDVKRSLKNE